MGNNGSKPFVGRKEASWYKHHPSRPSAKALPVLTIIFWASEDGTFSYAIGWLEDAIPDKLRLQKLNQAIDQHIESIISDMIRLKLIRPEEDKFALVK